MSAPIPASGSAGILDEQPAQQPASLTTLEHFRLADVLLRVAETRTPVLPFSRVYPEFTAADARRVREAILNRRLARGERRIGAKILPGGQFGWLTEASLLSTGDLRADDFICARVEGKVAVRLPETGTFTEVIPCVEILDTCFQGPATELSPADLIAAGACASQLLLGHPVPGGPLGARERISLIRLAEQVRACGHELPAGSLLLSGPLAEAVALTPGELAIELAPLGSLRLRVSPPASSPLSPRSPVALPAGGDPHVV